MRGVAPEYEIVPPLGRTGPNVSVFEAPHLSPLEVAYHYLLIH